MTKFLNSITRRKPKNKTKNKWLVVFILLVFFSTLFLTISKTLQKSQQFSYNLTPDSTILEISGNYSYINETNTFRTKFKKSPFEASSVSFAGPKGGIDFYTPKSQSFGSLQDTTPQSQANILTYPNIFPGVSLRYTISPTRLLEEFIVQDASTATKLTKIEQLANTYNDYQENDDGSITFTKGKDPAFILPKPVIYELGNKENKSYGIKYEISRSFFGKITISKILTEEGISWLNEPSRNYPIAIDLVIDNADVYTNWISSDPTNTTVSQETSIKHGGTGSIKVQTTAGTFPGTVDSFEFDSNQAARTNTTTNTISATGGTISYVGGYTVHTFTNSGTFTVNSGSGNVEVLVVGGGGGGGSDMGGGGGGGGVVYNSAYAVSPGAVTVTVGGGGAGAPAGISQVRGTNGQNSVFGNITAIGGGGGASEYGNNNSPAGSGGSGGGAAGCNSTTGAAGTAGQGYAGGSSGGCYYPGGGGGAGGPGYTNPADGGPGLPFSINGTLLYYGGGGGGAGYSARAGNGGLGGGGGGGPLVSGGGFGGGSALNRGKNAVAGSLVSQTNVPGGNGGANTGGGGDGGAHYNSNNYGGNGGSGVVIVRYPIPSLEVFSSSNFSASNGTVSNSGGNTIHTFTSNGTFSVNSGSERARVMVIGGGGGGGSDMGGGGGAGGYIYNASYQLVPGNYLVNIGAGGAGAPAGVSQLLENLWPLVEVAELLSMEITIALPTAVEVVVERHQALTCMVVTG